MSTILQIFINNQLMEIKPNDEEFNKLKAAATNLSRNEFKRKNQISKYTLIAFDPDIPESEPCLEKVRLLIEKQSPTILGRSKGLPKNTIRAVILEALYTRALADVDYARIMWNTMSSMCRYYNFGQQRKILNNIINEVAEVVEQAALRVWVQSDQVSTDIIEPIEVEVTSLDIFKSDIQKFQENFYNSFQHEGWGGKNPYVHTQNNENWGNHFGEQGAKAISRLFKRGFEINQNKIIELFQQLNKSLERIKPYLDEVADQSLTITRSVGNRNQLLWWKEALYSNVLKKSYRHVDNKILPFIMALDLNSLVTEIYPVSVDYLLKETLNSVNESNSSIVLETFIKELTKSKDRHQFEKFLPKITILDGRINLLDYVLSIFNGEIDELDSIKSRIGIDPKKEIAMDELAVWVFHELQNTRTGSH